MRGTPSVTGRSSPFRKLAAELWDAVRGEIELTDVKANESETLGENTIYSYLKALKKIFVIEDSEA